LANTTNLIGKNAYPLSTGKKVHNFKSIFNHLTETNGASNYSRKLFTPQVMGHPNVGNGSQQILSGSKTNERLMDRFIPCRIGENL
jgi:hypothetical protein